MHLYMHHPFHNQTITSVYRHNVQIKMLYPKLIFCTLLFLVMIIMLWYLALGNIKQVFVPSGWWERDSARSK